MREWFAGPAPLNVDGFVEVLRLRLRRADPSYRPTARAATAALATIKEHRAERANSDRALLAKPVR